ncbi:MAG: hypothetical protein E6K82_08580 [Candidatus Rokuibacteriota bacterium]|nr:MAG: hypothetical protein E6K82_08580 [Candidatus Rokubacteria bacterium]
MRRALAGLLGALSLAGCAGHQGAEMRSAEQALAAAGFQARPADTPEKLAQLQSLAPRKVLWRPQDGELRYVYADPTSCRCLYVGGEEQYQRLRRHEQVTVDRFFAVEASRNTIDWGLWEILGR